MDDPTLYNQITVKNIDNEDFNFVVNREPYMIGAGEIRVFPKFMVRPMLKHLIDKILIKRDPEGKLLRNQQLRDDLAAEIVLKEEAYEKPKRPTDRDIVADMNRQPELDRLLAKNKTELKEKEVDLVPQPKIETKDLVAPTPKQIEKEKKVVVKESKSVVKPSPVKTEKFDQIEEEAERSMPTKEQMLNYAKNTLKLNVSDSKTKKAWDSMKDEDLYKELGLDQENDLKSLGL